MNFFQGEARAIATITSSPDVLLPAIALGELYLGVRRCKQPQTETAKIEAFATRCTPLHVDFETGKHFADILHHLERTGQRIPSNDTWIAALAIQHNCPLFAADAHFTRITDLKLA